MRVLSMRRVRVKIITVVPPFCLSPGNDVQGLLVRLLAMIRLSMMLLPRDTRVGGLTGHAYVICVQSNACGRCMRVFRTLYVGKWDEIPRLCHRYVLSPGNGVLRLLVASYCDD